MAFKRSAVRSRLSPPGRLAQLVAHPLDVREVTSSSLVSSTTKTTPKGVVFLFSNRWVRQLIRYSYQIQYCLAELKMLGKYTEIDEEELKAVQRDYGRRPI